MEKNINFLNKNIINNFDQILQQQLLDNRFLTTKALNIGPRRPPPNKGKRPLKKDKQPPEKNDLPQKPQSTPENEPLPQEDNQQTSPDLKNNQQSEELTDKKEKQQPISEEINPPNNEIDTNGIDIIDWQNEINTNQEIDNNNENEINNNEIAGGFFIDNNGTYNSDEDIPDFEDLFTSDSSADNDIPFADKKVENVEDIQQKQKSQLTPEEKNMLAVNNCSIKENIENLQNPEEIKQLILNNKSEEIKALFNQSQVSNVYDLIKITSTIFNSAFNNPGFKAMIKPNLEYNISLVLNDFIRSLYDSLFNIQTLKENNFINPKVEDSIKNTVQHFFDHFLSGENKNSVLNSTDINRKKQIYNLPILLHQFVKKYCLDYKQKTLKYDDNITIEQLSTDPIKTVKFKEGQDIFTSFLPSQVQEIINDIKAMCERMTTFCKNFGTWIRQLGTLNANQQFMIQKWDRIINAKVAILQYHINKHPELQLREACGLKPAAYMNNIIRKEIIHRLNIIHKELYQDLNNIRKMLAIVQKFRLKQEVYDDLRQDKDIHNMLLYGLDIDTIISQQRTDLLDMLDDMNIHMLQQKRQQSKSLEQLLGINKDARQNRILIRLASNIDTMRLQQFYQQPYGKLLIGILCGDDGLGVSRQFGFQCHDKAHEKQAMTTPKLKSYIRKLLSANSEKLYKLQNDIIDIVKHALHDNNKLISIIPEINLLTNIRVISVISPVEKEYSKIDDIFANSNVQLIDYIMWRFSHGGSNKNQELKRYFRQYVLQPRIIQILNKILPDLIDQTLTDINNSRLLNI